MPRSHPSTSHDRPFRRWAVVGFLLLLIAVIYGQTVGFGFLAYDDHSFVLDCRPVRAGLTGSGVVWAFSDGPFGEWYPLAMLSHMLDCQIFGLDAWGHHLTNVLLHAAASIALFLVLRRMTGEFWPSAFVAVILAVHPQHVESVAWVAERRDVLSGLLFMLTLAAYLGYVRHGRSPGRYVLTAVLFALGLLAKPMLVTLPVVLVLLDFWPLGRFGGADDLPQNTSPLPGPNAGGESVWWLVAEKLPLFALAAGDSLMTLRTHASSGVTVPWSVRAGNAAVSCVTYVVQVFYPVDLAVFYPIPPGGHPAWKVAGAIAVLVATSAAAIFWRRRCPYVFVGWFWYLGMVAPVLGLVKVGWLAMADRYMYLPGVGLSIAVTWGAVRLAAGWPARRWVLGGCGGLAIAILTSLATSQAAYWHDDLTLWTHSLATTEDNAEAEVGLADALAALNRLDEAIAHYRRGAKLQTDAPLLNNLGTALGREGKYDEAAEQFRQAIEIDPAYASAHANMGNVLALQGHPVEAAQQYRRAIELDSSLVLPHFKLANLLLKEGQTDEAMIHFERVIALDPGHAGAHTGLAIALAKRGEADRAITEYLAALAIDPAFSPAHAEVARALVASGQLQQAMEYCRHALEVAPNDAAVRQLLAELLEAQKQAR